MFWVGSRNLTISKPLSKPLGNGIPVIQMAMMTEDKLTNQLEKLVFSCFLNQIMIKLYKETTVAQRLY